VITLGASRAWAEPYALRCQGRKWPWSRTTHARIPSSGL